MTRWIAMIGLLCLLVVTSGGATVIGRAAMEGGYWDRGVYPATKLDAFAVGGLCTLGVEDTPLAVLLVPIVLLEVPFSLIFDTVLLPWDKVRD